MQISLYLPAGVNTRVIQYNGQGFARKSLVMLCQKQDKGIQITPLNWNTAIHREMSFQWTLINYSLPAETWHS